MSWRTSGQARFPARWPISLANASTQGLARLREILNQRTRTLKNEQREHPSHSKNARKNTLLHS